MKKVLVVGYKGNMGSRYTAILDFLGIEWSGLEPFERKGNEQDIEGIILATPTITHPDILRSFENDYDLPILCEKPISRCGIFGKPSTLGLADFLSKTNLNIRMVNQYKYMPRADEAGAEGKTYYNYFKTGRDGLAWDCINIIGMAKGDVELKNDSPIWDCWINGKSLNIRGMDHAYIDMIDDWVKNPTNNHDYILESHEKVIKWIQQYK